MFIGRDRQLEMLQELLHRVSTVQDDKPGRAVLIRGRRRVGKSRLVEEFIQRAKVPHVYFAADRDTLEGHLAELGQEVMASNLPRTELFNEDPPTNWNGALRRLCDSLPDDEPCIVAIDEMPYLIDADARFEGSLQAVFDRYLSRKRVLFIGIGSDLAMMESINTYNRPFFQRASEMVVPPFTPAEVAERLNLDARDAFDAYLVCGGLPLILDEWPRGANVWKFLRTALSNPMSALLVSAERTMAAEFPHEAQARELLTTIGGHGARNFSTISERARLSSTSTSRGIDILTSKRMVQVSQPLSTHVSRNRRYAVADPYLRFWLTFIAPNMHRIERGSVEPLLANIKKSWDSWRGRAIEPILQESLARMDLTFGDEEIPGEVGGYWTRNNSVEVDIVVADKVPVADAVYAVGSIKWREDGPFDDADVARLITQRPQVPGASAETPLVVISRNGCSAATPPGTRVLGPEELLNAWR